MFSGTSTSWMPDRGLREGCPSSPPLFNIYHDAVMQDFRARRQAAAMQDKRVPGIDWHYKVDGRISIRGFRARAATDPKRVRGGKWGS